MPAVMIRFDPNVFTTGLLANFANDKNKIRWVMQSGIESSPHINHGVWFNDQYPQPPNSISIVVKGDHPSWFDSPDEFNRLPYNEIRAQIANEVERGILQVVDSAGSPTTAAAIRGGTVA